MNLRTNKTFFVAGLGLVLLMSVDLVHAWGRYGHEVTGHLAALQLSPQAAEAIDELLDGRSLADVSVWADEVRPDRQETAPLHYVNAARGVVRPRAEDLALEQGNVYSAVLGYAELIVDETKSIDQRREALKFFVHFVGDLHQPLHAGFADDRGANDFAVLYQGEPSSLHRYWDTQILDHYAARYSSEQLAAILHQQHRGMLAEWVSLQAPADWVTEARGIIFAGVYPMPQVDQSHPDVEGEVAVLDEQYREVWLPVAEKQLVRAGVRMAHALNRLFAEGQSPFPPPPIEFPPEP